VLTSITWEREGFALADGHDEATGRYRGLVLPGGDARFGAVTDSTLLVMPAAATQQAAAAPSPAPVNRRYFGVYSVDPERYGRDLTRLSQEILQPLTSVDGAQVCISVEIHAERPEGFPEDKIRVIHENARTLRFDQSGFEDS
jgi:hypothetical protein